MHLRMILCSGAVSCGERWLQAITQIFDHRWNVKMLIRHGFLKDLSHFSVELRDLLCDIEEELAKTCGSGESFAIPELSGYVRTPANIPVVSNGFFPVAPRTTPMPVFGPRTKLDVWYKETMGEERKTTWSDAAEVAAVLGHPQTMLQA